MKDKNGNENCNGLQNCRGCIECDNSTYCDNSTGCDNSTRCDNSTYCDMCGGLVNECEPCESFRMLIQKLKGDRNEL